MSLIFRCGNCKHEGVRAGNGFATWCAGCGLNSMLTFVEDTEKTRATINGNRHLANLKVVTYDDLHIVIESPETGTVIVTIYRGSDPSPISKETYGYDSSNLDKHTEGGIPASSL